MTTEARLMASSVSNSGSIPNSLKPSNRSSLTANRAPRFNKSITFDRSPRRGVFLLNVTSSIPSFS